MSSLAYLSEKVAANTELLNQIIANSKRTEEFAEQSPLVPTSKIRVSNAGVSEWLEIQKILDAVPNSGGGTSGSQIIPVTYTNQSTAVSNNYKAYHTIKTFTPSILGQNQDCWLTGELLNQRLVYMFGKAYPLKHIIYINFFNNLTGTSDPVTNTGNAGIKGNKTYSIISPNFIPSENHGSITTDYFGIYSDDFIKQLTGDQINVITLDNSINSYGVVIDPETNHGSTSNLGFRKVLFMT
jgi:hypothetical protein